MLGDSQLTSGRRCNYFTPTSPSAVRGHFSTREKQVQISQPYGFMLFHPTRSRISSKSGRKLRRKDDGIGAVLLSAVRQSSQVDRSLHHRHECGSSTQPSEPLSVHTAFLIIDKTTHNIDIRWLVTQLTPYWWKCFPEENRPLSHQVSFTRVLSLDKIKLLCTSVSFYYFLVLNHNSLWRNRF